MTIVLGVKNRVYALKGAMLLLGGEGWGVLHPHRLEAEELAAELFCSEAQRGNRKHQTNMYL